jgi:V/A-type H+-transporting ATPase subunit E
MDTQLQEIITKIHDEGVKGAEERAGQIVEAAEKQAKERIERARAEADEMRKAAEQDAAKTKAAGEAALKQASRDLLLSVKKEIENVFETVQKEAVGEAMSAERMAEMIQTVVTSWASGKGESLDVLVAPGDRDALEAALKGRLTEKLKSGYEVRPVRGINAGFRVGGGDSAAFLDFTDETIAELLAAYLNPRLSELMRDAGRA